LLTVFEIVMPLGPVLLLLSIRLPVPVMPPEWVKTAAPLFASVSPPAPSVVAPEISTVPTPVPLVIATAFAPCVMAPERVRLRLVVAWLIVRLLFSATEPLKVVLFVTPVIERVPEEPERTVILLVNVPAREDVRLALLLPPVSPSRIAPVPKAEALVEPFTVPLKIVKLPEKEFAPVRVRLPAPAFVRPKPAPEIMPPTVSVEALTVTIRFAFMATAPVPRSRVFVPLNVKSPFQFCTLLLVVVRAAVTSIVPPLMVTTFPEPPSAVFAPRTSVPVFSVNPPVKVLLLAGERMSIPVPFLVIPPVLVRGLSMVNAPLPLWSTSRLLLKTTEPVLLPIVKFPSAPEATVKLALPEAAWKVRFAPPPPPAVVVKRIVTLPSARSLKVKLRIVLTAPKKEGLVLVFELPKVMSVVVP